MSEKQRWFFILGGAALLAFGFGGLIVLQHRTIEDTRAEIESLDGEIAAARALISKSPDLEREVILQRETDEVVAEILPNHKDVNDLVLTLHSFEAQSGIKITSLKPVKINDREKRDFEKVAYNLNFDGDAFQLLSFIDMVESHPRFMSVPAFKLQAARRPKANVGAEDELRHKVQLDVETYVYEPKTGASGVKIENYDRKRDNLLGEIARRRSELTIPVYHFGGPRGRRDPWVDPRVPMTDDPPLTIEQQIELVDGLAERMAVVWGLLEEMLVTETIVEEMKVYHSLETELVAVEEEIRRVEAEGKLRFHSALQRFQKDVVLAAAEVREALSDARGLDGATAEEIDQVARAMERHLVRGEYDLALDAYAHIADRLGPAELEPERLPLVNGLYGLENTASAYREFDNMQIDVRGVLLHEGMSPVAVINGASVAVGELLESGVLVQTIRKDEIEFLYRGVVFVKTVQQ